MGMSSSFCKEKGWESLPMCQFPHTQQSHREGLLPTSPHHGPTQCSWSCQDIFENRFETCIPPHMHCRGGQTQNSILNLLWVIQMESYALWPFQCPSSVSMMFWETS